MQVGDIMHTDVKAASADASGKAAERRHTQKATGFSGNVPTEYNRASHQELTC
jgi:hypothetical protein